MEDVRVSLADLSLQDSISGEAVGTTGATIHLKTSLLVPGLHSEHVPLTDAIGSVGALLREIGRRAEVSLIDAAGEPIDFLDVRLNDIKLAFHPAGLDTRLKPGDRVLIRLVPIGGG
jgi:hypothetical protein